MSNHWLTDDCEVEHDSRSKHVGYNKSVALPSFAGLLSVFLTVPAQAFSSSISLLAKNLPNALRLRELTTDLKLTPGSLRSVHGFLGKLVGVVVAHRRPCLSSFRINLACYIPLSKGTGDTPLGKEVLKVVAFLESIHKRPDFLQAEFFYPLGQKCSKQKLENFLRPYSSQKSIQ